MARGRYPQSMSLLFPAPHHLPGALPPDRRAALQPARGWLRAAPPLEKGEPFPRPLPRCTLTSTSNSLSPVSEKAGKVMYSAAGNA